MGAELKLEGAFPLKTCVNKVISGNPASALWIA